MSSERDNYYEMRAQQELERAQEATDLSAAMAHRELAALYFERANVSEPSPALQAEAA